MAKDILELIISVEGSKTPFYRRVQLASVTDFIDLHDIIQTLMDWSDEKYFLFQSETAIITDNLQWDEDIYPEAYDVFETRLCDLLQVGSQINYRYFEEESDFDWTLNIKVASEMDEEPQKEYPCCIEAVGGYLREDFKDIEDYYRILAIFNAPKHKDYEEIREWLGEDFDADFFDMADKNEELESISDYFLDELEAGIENENHYTLNQFLQMPHIASNELQLESARQQFEQYKALGEKAMEQVPEEGLFWQFNEESNSVALIVKHLWGNMLSRWTDFLTTDGEKEWRERDTEFEQDFNTRNELMDKWELGWACLFEALDELNGADWDKTVYIRKQPHLVWQAVNRQIAHYAYHVGQIIFLSKMLAQGWESLSIPKGKSKEFNDKMM